MLKTVTLYPRYITQDAAMDNIVGDGTRAGGEDYRTLQPSSVLYVGSVAFDMFPLRGLSAACRLNDYSITFNHKCGTGTGGTELYWTFTPLALWNASLNGKYITDATSVTLGNKTVQSGTSGGKYLVEPRTRSLYNGVDDTIIGSSALLGVYLSGTNPAIFKYKWYLNQLSASVTYEARYYAKFYDDDGTLLKTQTLNANARPTAPNVSRTGYSVKWRMNGVEYDTLPTSVDTDLSFVAVYYPNQYEIGLYHPNKGTVTLEQYVNNQWIPATAQTGDIIDYYTVHYGDQYRVKTHGCNTTAEDLVVRTLDLQSGNMLSSDTVNGGASTELTAIESTVSRSIMVSVQEQTVTIPVRTSIESGAGYITPSYSVSRHGNATVVITPQTGYTLTGVSVNNDPVTVTGSITIEDVTAEVTIKATFTQIPYTITFDVPNYVTVTDGDGNTITGSTVVGHGDSRTFVFSCDTDHSLTELTLDGGENLLGVVFKQLKEYSFDMGNITEAHAFVCSATNNLVSVSVAELTGATINGESGKFIKQDSGGLSLEYTIDVAEGYRFIEWFDDSTSIPLVFTPTSTTEISATVEAKTIKITPAINKDKAEAYDGLFWVDEDEGAGGRVLIDGQEGFNYISADETASVLIEPSAGFHVRSCQTKQTGGSWQTIVFEPDEDGNVSFDIVEPTADTTVRVYFGRYEYTLTVTPNTETCSVSIEPLNKYGDTDKYYHGSFPVLTAVSGEGWYLDGWSDTSDRSTKRTVKVDAANVEITAIFKKFTFEQTYEAHEGGSVEGLPYVEYGDDLNITITAEPCFKIKDVLLDGASILDKVTLTRTGGMILLTNVKEAHTFDVFFESRIYSGRRLLDYYPPVIASIEDIQKLMQVLQATDFQLWDAASFIMENQYIDSATNEGVTMWERELGIVPEPSDTLVERKARLRLKWVPNNRFTLRWLHDWLEESCGTSIEKPTVKDYTLKVVLPWFVQWKNVFRDLEQYKPANILLDPFVRLPSKDIKLLTGFALKTEISYTIGGSDDLTPFEETADPPIEIPGQA